MRIIIYLWFLIININNIELCLAKDLGKHAQTFNITEEGFVQMMKEKLSKIDINKENKKMQKKMKKKIKEPKPVEGIAKAIVERIFYYDPTFIVKEDIVFPGGKILHKVGTRANPLDHMSLNRRIIFIDARDPDQVNWLNKIIKSAFGNVLKDYQNSKTTPIIEDRIILIAGKPIELGKELKRSVYFDQQGEITTKLGIKAVPAIAEQEGNKIKIQEILINDEL